MTSRLGGTASAFPEVREIHVESLLGNRLRDIDGNSLGRIRDVIAEVEGTDWVVREVHIGKGALVQRLIELSTLLPFVDRLVRKATKRYRVPWAQLDLADPSSPRTTVRRGELERTDR
ncbi:MAG: hypothetical protein ACJ796_05810 [Gemmatimonadaceae bacterium]